MQIFKTFADLVQDDVQEHLDDLNDSFPEAGGFPDPEIRVIERDGFGWRPWRDEPFVVIVAPTHPLGRAKSISRKELAELPLIGGEEGTGTGRILRDYFADMPMPNVSMRLGSTEAVKRAVEAGLGASLVLACSVEQEVREGRLRAIALREHPLKKSLRLVWRNDLPREDPLIAFLARSGLHA